MSYDMKYIGKHVGLSLDKGVTKTEFIDRDQ